MIFAFQEIKTEDKGHSKSGRTAQDTTPCLVEV